MHQVLAHKGSSTVSTEPAGILDNEVERPKQCPSQANDNQFQVPMMPVLRRISNSSWRHLSLGLAFIGIAASLPNAPFSQAIPNEFQGKVVAVKDGDTIEVLYDSVAIRIRLAHVDCPESGQPFGKAAKKFASDLCYGKTVKVIQQGRPDRFGRTIALVYVGHRCLNMALVEAGYAWHFKRYSSDTAYALAEELARLQKVGLWSDPASIAPWEWRRIRRGGKVN